MNWKKLFFAFIAAFIFIFFFGWFFHEVVLKDVYTQVPSNLMRTPDEFRAHFGWLVAGQLIFAFIFALIFVSGFAAGGVGAGVRLGIMLALLGTGARATISGQPHHVLEHRCNNRNGDCGRNRRRDLQACRAANVDYPQPL